MSLSLKRRLATLLVLTAALPLSAFADDTLRFGVGLFQPDKEKNDATYRPMADYLAKKLGRKVVLRTVDSWEGLAKSLANGETDIALLARTNMLKMDNASHYEAKKLNTITAVHVYKV